ncbi:Putative uncharacterized protein FLJ37770 [Araneus ventricosus]|uniref:Mos1 transposase HTH domain-containing protein n=1 Tax=Araneus ventricosus TaxID=182803 RepID=A0A4Y2SHL5_ARAVE|nr:Putative uncharacterized protein FLJ37770 [Araneus ventricosus]
MKNGDGDTRNVSESVRVETVSKKCVFEWFKRFRDGKEDVKDESRSGRPPTSITSDNIERVRRMLADDRRLSLRMIAEELKISLDSVSNIIHEHLQKRKKKGLRFSDVAQVQQRVTTVLRAIPKEVFADSFQQLHNRCQKCIVANGDYFECQ